MKNLHILLIVGTIGTNCFGYRPVVQMPVYREIELRDTREEQLKKELKEERRRAERNANAYAQVQVVYVRNPHGDNFNWLTTSDKNMLKYGLFGAIICMLVLRR